MPDPGVQLPVSADLSGAEKDGADWASGFVRGARGPLSGLFSGMLLGGGGPATQGPQGGNAVLDVLSKIHQTLHFGFAALLQGGGGGLGGPGSQGFKPPVAPQPDDRVPRRGGAQRAYSEGVGIAAQAYSAGFNVATSGGSDQSIAQAVGTALSIALPTLGPLVQAVTGSVVNRFNERDKFALAGLRRYQAGGIGGYNIDENSGKMNIDAERKSLGFGIDEFSDLYTRAQKAGALGVTPQADMTSLMRSERGFGAGADLTNLFGAARKTGSLENPTDEAFNKVGYDVGAKDLIGTAFGLAIGEGLTKARIPEALEQLTNAMMSNTIASTDMSATANRFLFISQLGRQFQGDTPGARQMNQTITGLGQGRTPYTNLSALMAGGMSSQGGSYAQAMLKMQTGVDVKGGLSSEELVRQNFEDWVPEYANADADGKAWVLLFLNSMTGINMAELKVIMDRLAKGKMSKVDVGAGTELFNKRTPKNLLKPMSQKAVGEDVWRPGVGAVFDAEKAESFGRKLWNGITGGESSSTTTSSEWMEKNVPAGGRYGVKRGDTDFHPGADVTLPGATVRSPFDGTIVAARDMSSTGAQGGAPGFGVRIQDDDTGRIFNAFHLDPKSVDKSRISAGKKIKKGDVIGTVFKEEDKKFPKGMATHVHVGMQKKGARGQGPDDTLDPAGEMNMEDVIQPNVPKPPAADSAPGSAGGGGAGAGTPTSMASPRQGVDVAVRIDVFDGRISVTKTAANRKQHGPPGRLGSRDKAG